MHEIAFLKNIIKNYAWGSSTAISELLGNPPSPFPQAELWMGAHPLGTSRLEFKGRTYGLDQWIEEFPDAILGSSAAAASFKQKLPFLFKILAVDKPLSLQTHPDEIQAKEGFEKENKKGIPLHSPERNFKDPCAKPEIVCALTSFWVLSGFRKPGEIVKLFRYVQLSSLERELQRLEKNPDAEGSHLFFSALLQLSEVQKKSAIAEAVLSAKKNISKDPAFFWIVKLSEKYPSDIGVLAPLLLKVIHLKSGEALFLPPGELHSYLEGFGLELMGNSDNVLRGGLTEKHVDIPGLLNILKFSERKAEIIKPVPVNETEKVFQTPAREFSLSLISMAQNQHYQASEKRSIEIMICTEGQGMIEAGTQKLGFERGQSWVVPAASAPYLLKGKASIYKATVPV